MICFLVWFLPCLFIGEFCLLVIFFKFFLLVYLFLSSIICILRLYYFTKGESEDESNDKDEGQGQNIYTFCNIYMLCRWNFDVISYLHVQGFKIDGKMNHFDGKSKKKINSAQFMDFFLKSVLQPNCTLQ